MSDMRQCGVLFRSVGLYRRTWRARILHTCAHPHTHTCLPRIDHASPACSPHTGFILALQPQQRQLPRRRVERLPLAHVRAAAPPPPHPAATVRARPQCPIHGQKRPFHFPSFSLVSKHMLTSFAFILLISHVYNAYLHRSQVAGPAGHRLPRLRHEPAQPRQGQHHQRRPPGPPGRRYVAILVAELKADVCVTVLADVSRY